MHSSSRLSPTSRSRSNASTTPTHAQGRSIVAETQSVAGTLVAPGAVGSCDRSRPGRRGCYASHGRRRRHGAVGRGRRSGSHAHDVGYADKHKHCENDRGGPRRS